jgi:acetyl esterase/lipase
MSERYISGLDPELAPGLHVYELLGFDGGTLDAAALTTLRAKASEFFERSREAYPLPDGVAIEDRQVPGPDGAPDITLRILRPDRGGRGLRPCIYSIHSGGMVMGRVDQDDATLSQLVLDLGCIAVSVDYRLAPEHPYPAGVEDCYAGLLWVHAHAGELSIDSDRLALLGSSGGGGLAAATALIARDRGGPPVRLQALLAPMLDDRDTPSSAEFSGIISWNREYNQGAWSMVLSDSTDKEVSAYAAPARATDLSGLPPAIIQVGELEVFRDEDVDYAARLMQAGVPVELHVYPGAYHGSELMAPGAQVSRRSRIDRVEALRRALAD